MMSSEETQIRNNDFGRVSHYENEQREQSRLARKRYREQLRAAFETAHEVLARKEFGAVAEVVDEQVLPTLSFDRRTLLEVSEEAEQRGRTYDGHIIRKVSRRGAKSLGNSPRRYKQLLKSLETVAVIDGPLASRLQEQQPVVEYEHRVGIRSLSKGHNVDKQIEAIDPDGEYKATLFAGSTGSGKSTSLGTVVEDRYDHGHKIVDLVEMNKAENVTYDVPAQHELADVRAEMGLDVGFEEMNAPEIEILVPMTTDLDSARIPVDEEGNTVVRPFTIPASELTFRQLITQLPHTTDVWEHAILSAYQRLDMGAGDWTLSDLVEEVQADPKVQPRVADRVESALETVQNKGFIRDTECPHTLDWHKIMRDQETVTAFTLFQVRGKLNKMLLASYLIDSIAEARDELKRMGTIKEFPPLSVVIREMHSVAPRNKSEHDGQRSVEELMIENLEEFFSLMRHARADILADTQKFHQQLDKNVSSHFDRFYCFGGHKKDIQKILNTRENPSGSPEEKISKYNNGKCCLVSGRLGYKMPIQFAPPRFHHLDSQRDGDGFSFRASVDRTGEKLEPAPWDVGLPERLRFANAEKNPVEAFCEIAILKTNNRNDATFKDELTVAYNKWAERNDRMEYGHRSLHGKIKRHMDLDDETDCQLMRDGERSSAHRTIKLKDDFRVGLEEIQEEFDY